MWARLIGIIYPKRCGVQNDESNIDEDPKFITGTNQPHNLDEYKYKSYEELSKEFQEVYPAAARAFVLIPQMYNRLTLVDGLTHKDGENIQWSCSSAWF